MNPILTLCLLYLTLSLMSWQGTIKTKESVGAAGWHFERDTVKVVECIKAGHGSGIWIKGYSVLTFKVKRYAKPLLTEISFYNAQLEAIESDSVSDFAKYDW